MRSERPVGGALFWALLGFVAAGLLLMAYLWRAGPSAQLDDHELDARARQGGAKVSNAFLGSWQTGDWR